MEKLDRQKILFISANLYPVTAGDSFFSRKFISELASTNALTVITLSNAPLSGEDSVIWYTVQEKKGIWKHLLRLLSNQALAIIGPTNFPRTLLFEEWDVIIVDHLRSYGIVRNRLIKLKYKSLFYVAHNVEILNTKQKIYFEKHRFNKLKARLNWGISYRESEIICKSDKVLALTENDAYVIRNIFFKKNVKNISLKINPCIETSSFGDILLVGSLNWYPNLTGVIDFLDHFKLYPDLNNKVIIIGAGGKGLITQDSRVSILGFVEDIGSIYARAGYLVVTSVFGTGIKMKIHDALEKGLKVLAIKEAAVGYNQSELTNLFVFENTNEIMLFLREMSYPN